MKRPRVVTMAQGARAAMASAGPRMNVANMLKPTISQGCHLCTIPASERLVSALTGRSSLADAARQYSPNRPLGMGRGISGYGASAMRDIFAVRRLGGATRNIAPKLIRWAEGEVVGADLKGEQPIYGNAVEHPKQVIGAAVRANSSQTTERSLTKIAEIYKIPKRRLRGDRSS